jgi:hypothetical protein
MRDFLKQVREGRMFRDIRERLGKVDELLEGVSFWKEEE